MNLAEKKPYIENGLKDDISEIKVAVKENNINIAKLFTAQAVSNKALEDHIIQSEKLIGETMPVLKMNCTRLDKMEGGMATFKLLFGGGFFLTLLLFFLSIITNHGGG